MKKFGYFLQNNQGFQIFSKLWMKFQTICSDLDFQQIVNAISQFDRWSRLASDTNLNLYEDHLRNLCCFEEHVNANCCATASLLNCLEKLGGFGGSVLFHVLAQHIGPFAWRHQMLEAVSEEGIESLHRSIKEDFENVSAKI